jgi:hypothetical protein
MFFWQNTMEPSMTHTTTICINLSLNLQNKLDIKEKGQRRWSHRLMFAHKSVPHLSSQRASARMAKTLSFHTVILPPLVFPGLEVKLSHWQTDKRFDPSLRRDGVSDQRLLQPPERRVPSEVQPRTDLFRRSRRQRPRGGNRIKRFFPSSPTKWLNMLKRLSLACLFTIV